MDKLGSCFFGIGIGTAGNGEMTYVSGWLDRAVFMALSTSLAMVLGIDTMQMPWS
jgi:hypothetical protein